jgi:hypothetical protein
MKRLFMFLCSIILVFGMGGSASAFFIDFEDGVDGGYINDITGVTFEDAFGYASIYGDSTTGNYNTTSDDLGYGSGDYHHNGNLWLWAGPNADARGVTIDFTENDGTWFQTGYSSYNTFYLEAYLTDGSVVSVQGASNLYGPMDFLRVDATGGTFIDYIVLHDSGNYWLVDDMSGDTSGVDNPVPEPATLFLMGSGLLGLVGYRRRRSNKN